MLLCIVLKLKVVHSGNYWTFWELTRHSFHFVVSCAVIGGEYLALAHLGDLEREPMPHVHSLSIQVSEPSLKFSVKR